MFIYYVIAKVQAYAIPSETRLIIRLPPRGTHRVMNLYRTESLPIYEPLLNTHVQIHRETMYMAVSESRQYYYLLMPVHHSKREQGLFCCATILALLIFHDLLFVPFVNHKLERNNTQGCGRSSAIRN
jgi:hypothetical protein